MKTTDSVGMTPEAFEQMKPRGGYDDRTPRLAYEQEGLPHMQTFEMFDPDEWDAILEDAL